MAGVSEPEQFERLYREHRGAVYRFLRRELGPYDAEDATQTAFAQAYGAYLRGSRPERPRAWLLTIADNLRRARFRRRRLADEAVPLEAELVPAPAADDRVQHLREALEALPLNQRAALVLREVAGLSYAEIGRTLRISVGGVQMLLFRARRSVREELALGRRTFTTLPTWLGQLLSNLERVGAPARAAGAAVAVAAATVVVPGAEPAAPSTLAMPPRVPSSGAVSPRHGSTQESAPLQVRSQPAAAPRAKGAGTDGEALPRHSSPVELETPRPKAARTSEPAPSAPSIEALPSALEPVELPLVPETAELPLSPPPLPPLAEAVPLPEPPPLPELPSVPPPPPLPEPLP